MKKWVCPVCGYVYEGENPPDKCPQCGVDGSKFTEQNTEMTWAAEHGQPVGSRIYFGRAGYADEARVVAVAVLHAGTQDLKTVVLPAVS